MDGKVILRFLRGNTLLAYVISVASVALAVLVRFAMGEQCRAYRSSPFTRAIAERWPTALRLKRLHDIARHSLLPATRCEGAKESTIRGGKGGPNSLNEHDLPCAEVGHAI